MTGIGRQAVLVSVMIVALCGVGAISAQEPADTFTVSPALADRGKKVFSNRQCNTCHTIGRGKAVGPDLRGLTARRSLDWIRRMIRTPEVMLLQDSTAQALRKEHGDIPMPNMKVTEQEVEALIHYIAAQSRK
ncbi:MAG TPA: cytochrome c [Gemmatimonadales bacterium]|jgi:mono/diheme cytochrome c family protein|nr:cytochrome c [Gemmatimonadales bacterium]